MPSIEDRPLERVDREGWEALRRAAGDRSPFTGHDWLAFLAQAFPGRQVGCLLALEGGKLVGGLPWVDDRSRLARQSFSLPWGTPAGPLVAAGQDRSLALELARRWAGTHDGGLLPTRLALTVDDPALGERLAEALPGFELRREQYFTIPLAGRSFAAWEAALPSEVRNQNRQARDRGVFTRVSDPAIAPELARLARLTAARHGQPAPLFAERFYRGLLERFGAREDSPVRVFLVRAEETPAAFAVCLEDSGRRWLWDYGADPELFAARPNNLMYASLVEDCCREGLEALELGAVPAGAAGLEHFKRSLGGVAFERATLVRAGLLFRLGNTALACRPGARGKRRP